MNIFLRPKNNINSSLKALKSVALGLAVATGLAACGSMNLTPPKKAPPPPPPPPAIVEANFQFGQKLVVRLLNEDLPMEAKFLEWVNQGVYTNAPIYRQLPGIFILTGKPRLNGLAFVPGTQPRPLAEKEKARKEASSSYVGLVIHADGTLGPELVITYGMCLRAYCEGPANIRIGEILDGQWTMKTVNRGDNLINIAIQPQ